MNLTPLRIRILRFLAERPNGYSPKGLVHELAPRLDSSGRPAYSWTEQGAARMAGRMINPLIDEGLVKDTDPFAPMYDRIVVITDKGRKLLADIDSAASRAELERAIASAA